MLITRLQKGYSKLRKVGLPFLFFLNDVVLFYFVFGSFRMPIVYIFFRFLRYVMSISS